MQPQQNPHASFSCLLIHQHSTVAFAYKLSACFNLRKSPNGSESQLTRKLKNCSIGSPVDFKQVLTSSNHSDILWGERSNKNKRWEFAWPQTDVPQPRLGSSLLWSVDGASGFCAAAKSVGRYWYPISSVTPKLLCIQRLCTKPRVSSLWPVILTIRPAVRCTTIIEFFIIQETKAERAPHWEPSSPDILIVLLSY